MFNNPILAFVVWFTASIFYAYQYILRVMPNIMISDMMEQFNIDSIIFGQFSGIYYVGYSLMHLPIGILLDRYGPRRVLPICILFTVAGLLPIIFSSNWVYPLIGRLLTGLGSSAAILGLFKIIRIAFAEKNFSRMLSFSVTIGLIGAIYGGAPLSYMCDVYGYKIVVQIFAFLGLVLACLIYILVPETTALSQVSSTVGGDIKKVLTNKKVILLCVLSGFMVGPLEGFADVWGAEFFRQVYELDKETANYLPSIIFIGMCFGAPFLSFIAEKTESYLGTIIYSAMIMLIVFTLLILKAFNVNGIIISFVVVGICCAYQILAIYKISTYVPDNLTGVATAVANMIIMFFGYAFHSIIGIIVENSSGASKFSPFIYGVVIIPIALLIAAIGFFFFSFYEKKLTQKLKLKLTN